MLFLAFDLRYRNIFIVFSKIFMTIEAENFLEVCQGRMQIQHSDWPALPGGSGSM